jgi:hypothetical protein
MRRVVMDGVLMIELHVRMPTVTTQQKIDMNAVGMGWLVYVVRVSFCRIQMKRASLDHRIALWFGKPQPPFGVNGDVVRRPPRSSVFLGVYDPFVLVGVHIAKQISLDPKPARGIGSCPCIGS